MTQGLIRRSAWITLLAILLNALAPTLAYAMASQIERRLIVELCNSYNLKQEPHALKHCPFCLSGVQSPPVPGVGPTLADLPPETLLGVVRDVHAVPDLLLYWSASHNRGPPARS
jgi:hypothetical protein